MSADHPDYCGCPKAGGSWGMSGWHLAISDGRVISRAGNALPAGTVYAYERCPAYAAGWRENHAAEKLEKRSSVFSI